MNLELPTCARCGVSNVAGAKFCSACGRDLLRKSVIQTVLGLSGMQALTLLSTVALVFGSAYGLQSYNHFRRGVQKPTEVYQPPANGGQPPAGHPGPSAPIKDDPELSALRAAAEKEPQDLPKLRAFAAGLADRLRSNPQAPPQLAFDAIDTLSRILQVLPEDPESLVMMADVSFDQRAFNKALEFYQRYLKLQPDDAGARARYASTLTFLGKYDDSIRELDGILAKDPKNFPAMAYLAITYAQQGKMDKAKELGATALSIAPTEEARARFSAFVTSLDSAENKGPAEELPRGQTASQGVPVIIAAIQNNPIAGQKFVRFEDKDPAVLRLYFKDFPMQAMPPFAKEKFYSGIRAKVKEAQVPTLKEIQFLDADSGLEMDRLAIE
jgi:tetratricopeptide (TPR) repeat protein